MSKIEELNVYVESTRLLKSVKTELLAITSVKEHVTDLIEKVEENGLGLYDFDDLYKMYNSLYDKELILRKEENRLEAIIIDFEYASHNRD